MCLHYIVCVSKRPQGRRVCGTLEIPRSMPGKSSAIVTYTPDTSQSLRIAHQNTVAVTDVVEVILRFQALVPESREFQHNIQVVFADMMWNIDKIRDLVVKADSNDVGIMFLIDCICPGMFEMTVDEGPVPVG